MKPKFKPHDLTTIQLPTSARRRVVEVLSYPIPADGPEDIAESGTDCNAIETIMVRMVPGDPTTLRKVATADLELERKPWERYCHIAEVRCSFDFPEDMLRYDCAALCNPDQNEDFRTDEPVLVYRLGGRRPRWTEARWQSFSASIKPVAVYDLSKQTCQPSAGRGGTNASA